MEVEGAVLIEPDAPVFRSDWGATPPAGTAGLVSPAPELAGAARTESAARCALVTVVDPEGVATPVGGVAETAVMPLALPRPAVGAELPRRIAPGAALTEPTGAVAPGAACTALVAPTVDVALGESAGDLSAARQESAASARHRSAIAERGKRYGDGGCAMMTCEASRSARRILECNAGIGSRLEATAACGEGRRAIELPGPLAGFSSRHLEPTGTLSMRRFSRSITPSLLVAASALVAGRAIAQPATPRQTQADDYTRYELLAPGSGKFRIFYEVTATTGGASQFFNVIRRGSVASDERVLDRRTGAALRFDVVSGDVARAAGVTNADSSGQFIRIYLAQPVPREGGARLLIDKTYYDPKSYYEENGLLVFTRPLGIKRNAVVLPRGYELISSNVPSQVITEGDGRIAISFWNSMPAEAPLTLRARPLATSAAVASRATTASPAEAQGAVRAGTAPAAATSPAASRLPVAERAHQDRQIAYFLQQPETHAFDLYHDYTESRVGVDRYLNIVRAGSAVSKPSARNLDTGEELRWEILRGEEITRAKLDVPDVTPRTQLVVFRFAPVPPNGSTRLRMYETYTDSARYGLEGDVLVWDRSFGRPANSVTLPAGWYLTNSAIPATVTEAGDGRIRLEFINARPDEIAVLITARRR